jgi:DNA modification methylase
MLSQLKGQMNLEDNALCLCDALILLERLPSGVVTLAYLDPPWNTGSGLEWNTAKSGEFSNEQCASYLSKVVQQVRRVLNDRGSLFVHWSPTSLFDVRLVMNQAFGDQPKHEITWHRKRLGSSADKRPIVDNEFMLVYSKTDKPIYNPIFRPLSEEEKTIYRLTDERGAFRAAELTTQLDRPAAQFTWRGYQLPPRRSWRFPLDKLEALALDNRIYFPASGGMPRIKQYLADNPGVEIGTTWEDIPSIVPSHERTRYAIQRPFALMERIVQLASNAGDQILDPFCGSGTTLVAAQSLGRHWWGADSSAEAHQIIVDRLATNCGLEARKDYAILAEAAMIAWPAVAASYRDIIASVDEIAKLQREISDLTDHLLSLKRLMNISEDDEGRVEEAIEQMQNWITISVANQSKSVDCYIGVVCSWLTGWEQLDKASQSFLPQAELLLENIARTSGEDYSPFILQYCRALENELLTKLFAAYTDDLHSRHQDINRFLAKDIDDEKSGKFAKSVQKRKSAYTLGEMNFIMGLMKEGGQTLGSSALLQDFRSFAVRYFGERIVDKTYLEQIDMINRDFRCKAAHPYVLDSEVARRCREQVRACLNELILNYKGGTVRADSRANYETEAP